MTVRTVTLLDYGMANLLNVARALQHCGADVSIVETPREAREADRLIVPGVGAFQHAMDEIRSRGLDDAVKAHAASGRPLLGICVGMQMLFEVSEEFGEHEGLGILPGRVRALPNRTVAGGEQRVPHIGWNQLRAPASDRTWTDSVLGSFVDEEPAMYFVHSFSADPGLQSDRLADCIYGGHRICAAVQRGNVTATQFHPERSGEAGLQLLRAFVET